MKRICVVFLVFLCPFLSAQKRSFDSIYPGISEEQRNRVFSGTGFLSNSERSAGFNLLPLEIDHDIVASVTGRNPLMVVESLVVIPDPDNVIGLIDIYNALGKVRDIKGKLYHSETRKADVPLFEEASRIDSRKNTAIPDPPPAGRVPRSETVFLRLKDANFGNCYYRADLSVTNRGLSYRLVNNKTINYIFFPVIKEGQFTAQLYLEPINGGVLVYALAGADVSDFVSSRIDIPSALAKRLAVIVSWVSGGLLEK